tara:strand:+ start:204 stop:485 length:282 start_codon:yes stop_codon:yes gene_type:complete
MNNLDKSFIIPVKIYITSTPTGFACGIENEEIYHSDKYYVTMTLARGLVRLLTKNPDFVFDEGISTLNEELLDSPEIDLDFEKFLEKRRNKLN